MHALLAKILTVRSYVVSMIGLVSLVTLAVLALVIMLSIRLRRRELITMTKMGCSRSAIGSILGSQIAIIVCGSLLLATMLTALVAVYGEELVRQVVLRM
jgi:putative ABC transport system permease protein